MCGIIGMILNRDTAIGKMLIHSLKKLEYRGYDSMGIAILDNSQVKVFKDKGKIDQVAKDLPIETIFGKIGIGHSRWATHGKPSRENAHPHADCNNKLALVHNGIIENYRQLKEDLIRKGHTFRSETDTEVIVHLVEELKKNGKSTFDAFKDAIKSLKGTYAVVMIDSEEPNKIFCAKKDSPLVIGVSEEGTYCASDIPAFLDHTNFIIQLKDLEMAVITSEEYEIYSLKDDARIERKPYKITWTSEMAQKGGYAHFMLKEIHEQPKVVTDTFLLSKEELTQEIINDLIDASLVVFTGMGTAYHAAQVGKLLMAKVLEKPVISEIASEIDNIINFIDENTVLIVISQSGETMDSIKALKKAKEKGAKIISIINMVGSTIESLSDHVLHTKAGPEIGVAATKTYTCQLAVVTKIYLEIAKSLGKMNVKDIDNIEKSIENLKDLLNSTITINELKSKNLAAKLIKRKSMYYLGRGLNIPTAYEGALKMKEISYIHAEAYPAGESKHGPIALIEDGFPVVFVIPQDEYKNKMIGNVMEMKARGAYSIGVIQENDHETKKELDYYFTIPGEVPEILTPILYIIPLQMLSYYSAILLNRDPDKPRNLAKSVTVE